MANGILETLQEQVAQLQLENRALLTQISMLATAVGLTKKTQIDGGVEPLTYTDLGLVSRGKFVYRPDDAPTIKPTSAKAAKEKLLSKELSGDDLDTELEIE